MIKLLVATPMYGGMSTGLYLSSMLGLQRAAIERGIVMGTTFMYNESLIPRARNELAKGFLESDFTHFLFIDADIHFNGEEVLRMIDADKDVICGIYPKKEINWQLVEQAVKRGVPWDQLKHYTGAFVVNVLDPTKDTVIENPAEPYEIANGGTGMMLIKRHVLEQMVKEVPQYFKDTFAAGESGQRLIYEFFATSIEPSGRLLSEDYHFCAVWRRMGGKVWLAPWVRLAHVGTYVFEGTPMVNWPPEPPAAEPAKPKAKRKR